MDFLDSGRVRLQMGWCDLPFPSKTAERPAGSLS